MGKYIEDAKELLTYVGGRTNISAVTPSMTMITPKSLFDNPFTNAGPPSL